MSRGSRIWLRRPRSGSPTKSAAGSYPENRAPWSIGEWKAGAHAAAHKHPHEQFVCLIKGAIRLRIGAEERTLKPNEIDVIPGGVEHEAFFPEDAEVIDFFAPAREDFLTGEPPPYMAPRATTRCGR